MSDKNPAIIILSRNKERFIARSVRSALAQTRTCEILISDQHSDDDSVRVIRSCVKGYDGPHTVRFLSCPVEGAYGMRACNEHFMWAKDQTDADWLFVTPADDYSLPDRVKLTMDAAARYRASAIGVTMLFQKPDDAEPYGASAFPDGYVQAGDGMKNLVYGSCCAAYHRKFIEKVGSAEDCTMDVYYGYLAALDYGYYVVNKPGYVHVEHADLNNMGFQGKMRAATGDDVYRMDELNRFQLFNLYYKTALRAQTLYPMAHPNDQWAIRQMVMDQAVGWLAARQNLHERGIHPGII